MGFIALYSAWMTYICVSAVKYIYYEIFNNDVYFYFIFFHFEYSFTCYEPKSKTKKKNSKMKIKPNKYVVECKWMNGIICTKMKKKKLIG